MGSPVSQDEHRKINILGSLLLPSAISIATFYLLYVFFLSHIWGDQAFLLYAAREVIAGVTLDGSRLIETNPPLIVWFSEIPVVIAKIFHISSVVALRTVTLLIVSASTGWGARLLRIGRIGGRLEVSPLLLTALVAIGELTIQPAMFGQREQLMLALVMPYVLALGTESSGSISMAERFAIGFCASLGVCFKPQQVLTLICLELFLVMYRRSLRHLISTELIVLMLTGLVYVACVRGFTPYFSVIVPLLRDTYWALGEVTWSRMLLHTGRLLTTVLLLAVISWFLLRRRMRVPLLSGAFLACSIGASVAFYVQHTGWSYQSFPAKAFLFLTISTLALDYFTARYSFNSVWPGKVALLSAIAVSVTAFAVVAGIKKHSQAQPEATGYAELESFPRGTVVYMFSIEMVQFPWILDRQLVWGSRFAHLWMLPAIIQNEAVRIDKTRPYKALSPQRTEELAAMQREATAEDFERWKPQYVFVEHCAKDSQCEVYNHPIDFISWFSKNPAFAAEWSKYRFEKSLDNFDMFVRN
jgi:hypothetical protein